jgi:hypothetical protein
VFDRLHLIFPNSKLGFAEVGTRKKNGEKNEYMHRYYELNIRGNYFVRGYFLWFYQGDCVPKTKELWGTLNIIIVRKQTVERARRLRPMMNLLLLSRE